MGKEKQAGEKNPSANDTNQGFEIIDNKMALDAYQPMAERRMGEQMNLPILYFTQLMGIALGIQERHLGLNRLLVSPAKVLARA